MESEIKAAAEQVLGDAVAALVVIQEQVSVIIRGKPKSALASYLGHFSDAGAAITLRIPRAPKAIEIVANPADMGHLAILEKLSHQERIPLYFVGADDELVERRTMIVGKFAQENLHALLSRAEIHLRAVSEPDWPTIMQEYRKSASETHLPGGTKPPIIIELKNGSLLRVI